MRMDGSSTLCRELCRRESGRVEAEGGEEDRQKWREGEEGGAEGGEEAERGEGWEGQREERRGQREGR